MNRLVQKIGILISLSMLAACGFQLRGMQETNFKSIFIQGKPITISKSLEKHLKNNEIQILSAPENAEVLLEILGEENEKRILSLSGGGVVREYELYYRVMYRTRTLGQPVWGEPQTVEARRDFSFSDANLVAKQGEERRLNENMQKDVLSNLVRRLSALKKK